MVLTPYALLLAAGAAQAVTCYVAPNGDDAWSGRLPQPNAGRTDGPFATPARAVACLREARLKDPAAPLRVQLRGGFYELSQPLMITPDLSGTAEAPTSLEAWPGETPVLSGGRRLTGWRVAGGRWTLDLPEVRRGEWRFSQLFVNGQRRLRPRVPESGYSFISDAVTPSAGPDQPPDRFRYDQGDLDAGWYDLNRVEGLVFHSWSMSRLPVKSVEAERRVVTFAGPTWNAKIATLSAGRRYLMENVREALKRPGQWYLDVPAGTLTYLPLPGEDPATAEVIAPRLGELVILAGDPDAGLPLEHVRLRGLSLQHTNWNVPERGYSVAQAEASADTTHLESPFGAVVRAVGARDCRIEGCTIAHTGFWAIELGRATRDCTIADCELWDLGAGGVKLGTAVSYPDNDPRLGRGHTVSDNLIAHGGRMHPAAVGVWIGHSPDNQVVHNTIADFYYTGISVGWQWSYGWSAAKRNDIGWNHIYDIGQERLADLGGIYTLGESQGTVLHHNRIHDVTRVEYGGSGIYFDQATTGILVEHNLVYRTRDAGFTVHFAKDNTVRNNIFALGREFQIGIGREDLSGALTFERNVVSWTEGRCTSRRKARPDFRFDHNLYWTTGDEPLLFADDRTWDQWRELGNDLHSVVEEPGFKDPAKGDFTLISTAAVEKIGFQPFDLSAAGRRTSSPRAAASPPVPHTYDPATAPPPRPIDESFEWLEPGDRPSRVHVYENNATEVIRVSDERAAGGKHSLKVIDGPGPGPSYNPHFFYEPRFRSGRIRGGFDLWLGRGATITHEWRDASHPYRIGPSLTIRPDGALLLRGRAEPAMVLPPEQWLHFELVCGLGDLSAEPWALTVTVPGQEPRRFEGLTRDPKMQELIWLGWIGGGTEPAVWYLDNLTLAPAE